MRCYRRLLIITYKDYIIDKEVCRKIQAVICRKGRAIDLGQETENLDNFANITRSAEVKGKRKDVDGRSRKTILRCGQGWPAQLGQLKTGQDGKRSWKHLWCPNDPASLWYNVD